jgi:outer membrane protein assembly factor BamB
MRTLFKTILPFAAVVALIGVSGCSTVSNIFEGEPDRIEGERISVLELERSLVPENVEGEVNLNLPPPWKNAFWPQAGGYPNHSMQNLALNSGVLEKVWSRDIDGFFASEIPIISSPIIVSGVIYTLNSKSDLMAIDATNGDKIWQSKAARSPNENSKDDDEIISGGVAYGAGLLYVSNGYSEVVAVNPKDGSVAWRKDIGAPSRAAPTIMNDNLYVSTIDNRLIAMNTSNGDVLWEHEGTSESTGLIGAGSPAASHDIVIPVFSSGDITALRVQNGSVAWSDNLSSLNRFGGVSGISDINALPVIDNGLVIAMNFSGRLLAIDERTGARVWQREIGGMNTPWVAGDYLFVLTKDNQLVAMARTTGAVEWVTTLQSKDNKKLAVLAGPVMGGGRLVLAGDNGTIIEVNAMNGELIRQWDAGRSVSIAPIVAGNMLYLLDERGVLSAYK